MPKITITEQEAISLSSFDVTENTVLVPMLYARSYTETSEGAIYDEAENLPGRIFNSLNSFMTWAANGTNNKFIWIRGLLGSGIYHEDKTYLMVCDLLASGLPVIVKPITFDNAQDKYHNFEDSEITNRAGKTFVTEEEAVELLKAKISVSDENTVSALDEFKDKNLYNIKFITTGAYTNNDHTSTSEISANTMYTKITEIAADRGDCLALIEYKEDYASNDEFISDLNTLVIASNGLYSVTPLSGNEYKYAASFYPWCLFSTAYSSVVSTVTMPACFAYLKAYANSVKTNANWFAASGVTRGVVPNLIKPLRDVGDAVMHVLQGDTKINTETAPFISNKVNPIYNAGLYGYRLWGNRVAWNNPDSSSLMYQEFLNVRILICDIRKQVYHSAMRMTFEPNDDIVWINFKTLANTLLDKMKSGRGIVYYKWTKELAPQLATIKASLTIKPIEAVESFDINIILTEEETTIEEEV